MFKKAVDDNHKKSIKKNTINIINEISNSIDNKGKGLKQIKKYYIYQLFKIFELKSKPSIKKIYFKFYRY